MAVVLRSSGEFTDGRVWGKFRHQFNDIVPTLPIRLCAYDRNRTWVGVFVSIATFTATVRIGSPSGGIVKTFQIIGANRPIQKWSISIADDAELIKQELWFLCDDNQNVICSESSCWCDQDKPDF